MILRTVFHLLMVVHYGAIFYFRGSVAGKLPKILQSFGGPWKFLTHWDLCFQLGYFSIALVNSLFGTDSSVKTKSSTLQTIRDFLFASVAFPFGLFVSVAFWSIYAYDDQLMWPTMLRKIFPPIANHMMHTSPLVGQVIELLLVHHIYPKQMFGLAMCGGIALSYLTWICVIAHFGGFWVYPVLGVMTTPVRTVFIMVCAVGSGLLYIIGESANSYIWKNYDEEESSKESAFGINQPIQHRYPTRARAKVQKAD